MVEQLANQLIEDIRRRGLSAGDRYLTTDQVGRMLGVRKTTANRVMQMLADGQYLVRRQRSGTFVGPQIETVGGAKRQVVHVLLHQDRGLGLLSCDELITGMQSAIPGVSVQFDFLPERDPVGFLDKLIQESGGNNQSVGLVPVSCPREVYQFLMDRSLPVVVLGSVFPDTDAIPSVDGDYAQAGKLVIDYLVAEGHRRLGLLTFQTWHPGENAMLESMNSALSQAGLPADSLILRSIPSETNLFEAEVKRLLASEQRPTALICRNQVFAAAAERAARSAGLSIPKDVTIIHEAASPVASASSPYPCVVRSISFRETAEMIGRMLILQLNAEELKSRHEVVPFHIHKPMQ